MKIFVRHDTPTWKMQTWVSFAVSFFLTTVAVWYMPSQSLDRLVAALGLLFVLSATFSLSKMIRDNQHKEVDTPSWKIQVWCSFGISTMLTAWGIYRMNIDSWHKVATVAAAFFLISSAFTLAKMLRDAQEAESLENANQAS